MSARLNLFDTLLMLILIVLWGGSFVVVKIALEERSTPVFIATLRFLLAGGFFIVMLGFQKTLNRDYRVLVETKDSPTLVFLALIGATLFFIAQYTGIQMAGASIAAIFVCLLSPIIIVALSAMIFGERLVKKQILGIGFAAAGTFIVIIGGSLSVPENAIVHSGDFFRGSLILLSTPFLWATYSLLGKKMMEKYDAFLVVAYVTILGGLCLIPFSLAEASLHRIFTLSVKGWLAILFLSITCSLIGYSIWFYVLKRVGAAVTSSFLFAEPLVTVLFAVVFAGEMLTFSILGGGLLIFVGVYLVTRGTRS